MPSFLLPSNQVNQCAYHSVHIKGRMRGVGAPCPFPSPLFGYTLLKDKAMGMRTADQV